MDDSPCRLFFSQPQDDHQRLYEALRAVFVEGARQKDAAGRFGLSFDAFRQQVRQFRSACAAGQASPFSPTLTWPTAAKDPRQNNISKSQCWRGWIS